MSACLGPTGWRGRLALICLMAAATVPQTRAGSEPPTRVLLVVKTLVIDALGTRTVDTDTARIPFGKTGLLIKKVPYGGPALSFKLSVRADSPQETGIPLLLSADVWPGEASPVPTPDRLSHREEATVLGESSSYLFEIDHDESTQRRILLSITARGIGEKEEIGPLPVAMPVHFLIEITRQREGLAAEPDTHALTTLMGRPVTFSSSVRPLSPNSEPGDAGNRSTGLTISLLPERADGDLITVSVELTGADFVDDEQTRLVPISHRDVHTVVSGTRFLVSVTVPGGTGPASGAGQGDAEEPEGNPTRPVTYVIFVTPTLD